MHRLIDGDPAANTGGWQWSAGTGKDAQPFFRIFHPVTQSMKFDPRGTYIRHWLPELRDVPDKFIHSPWKMDSPPKKLPAANRRSQLRARTSAGSVSSAERLIPQFLGEGKIWFYGAFHVTWT